MDISRPKVLSIRSSQKPPCRYRTHFEIIAHGVGATKSGVQAAMQVPWIAEHPATAAGMPRPNPKQPVRQLKVRRRGLADELSLTYQQQGRLYCSTGHSLRYKLFGRLRKPLVRRG
jgi:hypothetical protein